MNKTDYDALMRKFISDLTDCPPLILHSCCAPCSTRCIEELYGHFELTVLYYNPNMDTDEEYSRRAAEQKRFLEEFCTARPVKIVDYGHRAEDFLSVAEGRETLLEGGARCFDCYRLRMEKAAASCPPGGCFATTLTLSPLKNAEIINKIGFELAEKYGVRYLPSDFKKRGGYARSLVLSKEYGLYRQNYCGCVYSRR